MTVKPEDIRARVDGELDAPQARRVDRAVLADITLQQTADKLRASQLPYREAYNEAPVPDIPDSLQASVKALRYAATQSRATRSHLIDGPEIPNPTVQTLPVELENYRLKKPVGWIKPDGIAASVMIAALAGYLAGAGPATPVASPDALTVDNLLQLENFASRVAAYQEFYVRETLHGTVAPNPSKVSARLANQTGMQVVIPQFEDYKFMRAQRLSIDGNLLLQLVYLGAEGRPLALCYMASVKNEAAVQSNGTQKTIIENHHGLNTAEWQHSGHRFVIVSDASEKKLQELSQSTQRQWNS